MLQEKQNAVNLQTVITVQMKTLIVFPINT